MDKKLINELQANSKKCNDFINKGEIDEIDFLSQRYYFSHIVDGKEIEQKVIRLENNESLNIEMFQNETKINKEANMAENTMRAKILQEVSHNLSIMEATTTKLGKVQNLYILAGNLAVNADQKPLPLYTYGGKSITVDLSEEKQQKIKALLSEFGDDEIASRVTKIMSELQSEHGKTYSLQEVLQAKIQANNDYKKSKAITTENNKETVNKPGTVKEKTHNKEAKTMAENTQQEGKEAVGKNRLPLNISNAIYFMNDVKNGKSPLLQNDNPPLIVSHLTGKPFSGPNQLLAQKQLKDKKLDATELITYDQAKAYGGIKQGAKFAVVLTSYDKEKNENNNIFYFTKDDLNYPGKDREAPKFENVTPIDCKESEPEQYIGHYLAASYLGVKFNADKKVKDEFRKEYVAKMEDAFSQKKFGEFYKTLHAANEVSKGIIDKALEKAGLQQDKSQDKSQDKAKHRSDRDLGRE